MMLTGGGQRLQGTRWRALICFWRDFFKPYMPLRFGIVERRWSALIHFWQSVAGAFSFFISSLGYFFSFSSTFSSFLGFFFHFFFFPRLCFPTLLGYVIVEV